MGQRGRQPGLRGRAPGTPARRSQPGVRGRPLVRQRAAASPVSGAASLVRQRAAASPVSGALSRSLVLLKGTVCLQLWVAAALLVLPGLFGDAVSSNGTGRLNPGAGWWLYMAGITIQLHSLRIRLPRPVWLLTAMAIAATLYLGESGSLALVQEFTVRSDRFLQESLTHLQLAFGSACAAALVGIPLGILAYRSDTAGRVVFSLVSGVQTVPSLALFGLMIAPLALLSRSVPALRAVGLQGIGFAPAFLALLLYSLLPIVRNTYTSLAALPQDVLRAGQGMGMTRVQLFRYVELPLALPIVLAGVRTAAVQAVGNTTIAALIGAGGLGSFVFQGLGQGADDLIVLGVLPIVGLAVCTDRGLDALVRRLDYRTVIRNRTLEAA
ncbi:ABC-type proline/glycine betaine transport system, permease component [Spirochaeta africana DSM 8902]|uniref:ABC-type proline/glycine betaine transport system, permease component n=2 Tax=Spirochaeta TaxID=146 RepID=H9UI40_SPIAZ|nr:ABC-type proline/glycine betaine transport system, permease component [Spirochaeta africana DSM 8902]